MQTDRLRDKLSFNVYCLIFLFMKRKEMFYLIATI
jgi:hypothetical protein